MIFSDLHPLINHLLTSLINLRQNNIDEKQFTDQQLRVIIHYLIQNDYSTKDNFINKLKGSSEILEDKSTADVKNIISKLPQKSTTFLKPFYVTENTQIRQKAQVNIDCF